jgi:signal transduction histidine kinase
MKPVVGLATRLMLVLVLFFAAGQWVNYRTSSDIRSAALAQRELDRIKSISAIIEPQLTEEFDHLKLVAALLKGQFEATGTPTGRFLESVSKVLEHSEVDYLEVTDAKGVVTYSAREPGRAGQTSDSWGVDEALAGQPGLSSVNRVNGPVIVAITPVQRQDRVIGTVSVGRQLDDKFVLRLSKAVGADLALIARSGKVYAKSRATGEVPDAAAVIEAFSKKIPIFRNNFETNHTVVYLPSLIVDEAWVFMTSVDSTSAVELMNKGDRESVVVMLILLGVSSFLIWLFVRFSLLPLRALHGRVEQIVADLPQTESALAATGTKKGSGFPKDEIGRLARSFTRMVDALQDSREQLKKSNQQLTELNQSLDQRVRDEISKRKEQESLLIHQSRLAAMGEMIGAIAHQWRQPLNALSLVLQNIRLQYNSGTLTDDSMARMYDKSSQLVDRMSSTIDEFRNFFRPSKTAVPFALASAIRASIDIMDGVFRNHAIEVTLDCDESVQLAGVQGEFSQVMLNLLSNAKDAIIDAKVASGRVKINVSTQAGRLRIDLDDNGPGIDAAILQKIFEPYFSTKDEGKGSGIGLYMSKMIVENRMNGQLSASNLGPGARFTVDLPLIS